ncbi:cuticle protein 19.8-like [Melanaphis sacchari]|uniref:Cuticle protein 8 n=1 Tax=Melanaphis sacchari TaxID=742174 RepID=A0A2H8TDF3_9HEMI|nr:cuticle protein 19.8-like [Melanaphis sacchari]
MTAKLSHCRRVIAAFVVAACVVATAFPVHHHDEFRSQQDEYLPKNEHDDAAAGDDAHGPAGSTYHFQYAVHDPLTGDEKSQNEVGDGHGSVKGTYSLVEADGSTRVVEYTADDVHGFRAEVKRIEPPADRQQRDHRPSTATDVGRPPYGFDFAAEHAAPAADAQPAADYELQSSLHYSYEPELHFPSSHRR